MEDTVKTLNQKVNIIMHVKEDDKSRVQEIVRWSSEMVDMIVEERVKDKVIPKRGQIWLCKFGVNPGSLTNKTRPAIIVQNDVGNANSPTTIVIPITNRNHTLPTQTNLEETDFIYSLNEPFGISLAEQVKAVAKVQLVKQVGSLTEFAMKKINDTLKVSLGLH